VFVAAHCSVSDTCRTHWRKSAPSPDSVPVRCSVLRCVTVCRSAFAAACCSVSDTLALIKRPLPILLQCAAVRLLQRVAACCSMSYVLVLIKRPLSILRALPSARRILFHIYTHIHLHTYNMYIHICVYVHIYKYMCIYGGVLKSVYICMRESCFIYIDIHRFIYI